MSCRFPRLVLALAAGVTLAACGGGSEGEDAAPASTAAKTEAAPPAYKVVDDGTDSGGPRYVIVHVDAASRLREVFDDVRREYDEDERGVFVSIDCSTGGTKDVGNRLANGKYANGAMGAAQTGLDEGDAEFEAQPDAKCPAQ